MLKQALKLWDEERPHVPASFPALKLVPMPKATVTYVGDLYETPVQRHPQEPCLGEIYRVKGTKEDDGVYVIPGDFEDRDVRTLFLSNARKITNRLPRSKKGNYRTYGLNELAFDPPAKEPWDIEFPSEPTGIVDPEKKPALYRTLTSGIRLVHRRSFPVEFK